MCCLKMIVEILLFECRKSFVVDAAMNVKYDSILLSSSLLYKSHRMKSKERKTCGKENDRNEQTYASKPMRTEYKNRNDFGLFYLCFFHSLSLSLFLVLSAEDSKMKTTIRVDNQIENQNTHAKLVVYAL